MAPHRSEARLPTMNFYLDSRGILTFDLLKSGSHDPIFRSDFSLALFQLIGTYLSQ